MRIAVDAMGGDHAPRAVVRGAVDALNFLDGDIRLVLVGQEDTVRAELAQLDGWAGRIDVEHATQVVGMDEVPVDAVRHKRDSSLMRMVALAAAGNADAVVSAGNTGACAAACQLRLKTLAGVQRSGIAVVIPSTQGPKIVCDVGANIAPKPHHMHQYALMCGIYGQHVLGMESPRVGLLSVGEEDMKGTQLVKRAAQLIRDDSGVNFVGNVEGRDLFRGTCDVIICDGFVGNIVLKLTEGLAEGLFRTIREEMKDHSAELASRFEPILQTIWAKHDYSEYGGAPLLGVNGVCIICHGSSDHRAICNAVRVAHRFVAERVNAAIVRHLGQSAKVRNEQTD